jgi:peptidoglycan/LPS O-acetylase OafA/YrhL
MGISKTNNFNLIRLIAALQVLISHSMAHMEFQSNALKMFVKIISYVPGVPIFFTISGFLIYASFERNNELKSYFRSRFLRIFPALWICLLFTIVLLVYFGFINYTNVFSKPFLFWLATQFTFFQFYTPEMFRAFGVHSPNGSLWTIPVEISFYAVIPIIFNTIKSLKISRNYLLVFLSSLSIAYNYWYGMQYKQGANDSQTILIKFMGLNLIPYLFYFLFGSLAYENWRYIKGYYEGKGLIWLFIYIIYCLIFSVWLHKFDPSYWLNFYGLISMIILSQTILSLAYTAKNLSKNILNESDISYGTYLYHMPVVNIFIQLGYKGDNLVFLWILMFTMLLAFLSWRFIEKPMLSLKKANLKSKVSYAN